MGRSGFAKRASTCADCCDVGVLLLRAFLTGRWERRSAEVGMDSGMFSDMMVLCFSLCVSELCVLSYHEGVKYLRLLLIAISWFVTRGLGTRRLVHIR